MAPPIKPLIPAGIAPTPNTGAPTAAPAAAPAVAAARASPDFNTDPAAEATELISKEVNAVGLFTNPLTTPKIPFPSSL